MLVGATILGPFGRILGFSGGSNLRYSNSRVAIPGYFILGYSNTRVTIPGYSNTQVTIPEYSNPGSIFSGGTDTALHDVQLRSDSSDTTMESDDETKVKGVRMRKPDIPDDVNPTIEKSEGGDKEMTEGSITERSTLEPIDLELEYDPKDERERTERTLISIKAKIGDLFQFSNDEFQQQGDFDYLAEYSVK
ncbi:hypothetical protein L6452_01735 [Arctium lappa]|uniref:Uncharacterized protein n=1 Tax=Arctium lappa TaxID=4217 RepID=A0ACB9FHH6_ARCLA|nr:hypothetical protein L6452_01735 [Arctium lappa]